MRDPKATKMLFFLSKNKKNEKIERPEDAGVEIQKKIGGQKCVVPS